MRNRREKIKIVEEGIKTKLIKWWKRRKIKREMERGK